MSPSTSSCTKECRLKYDDVLSKNQRYKKSNDNLVYYNKKLDEEYAKSTARTGELKKQVNRFESIFVYVVINYKQNYIKSVIRMKSMNI